MLQAFSVEEFFGDDLIEKVDTGWVGFAYVRNHIGGNLKDFTVENELLLFSKDIDDGITKSADGIKVFCIDLFCERHHELFSSRLHRLRERVPKDDCVFGGEFFKNDIDKFFGREAIAEGNYG